MSSSDKTYLDILQEKTQKENSKRMDNETFKKLLDAGEIGQIMSEGGSNLTKKQLNLVKEKAKEQSEEKIFKKQLEIASQPGYAESILIPLKRKLLEQSFAPRKKEEIEETETYKAANQIQEKFSSPVIEKIIAPKKEERGKETFKMGKPNLFSALGGSTPVGKEPVEEDDVESGKKKMTGSMEKFTNLIQKIEQNKNEEFKEKIKYERELEKRKEKRHKEIIDLFIDASGAKARADRKLAKKKSTSGFLPIPIPIPLPVSLFGEEEEGEGEDVSEQKTAETPPGTMAPGGPTATPAPAGTPAAPGAPAPAGATAQKVAATSTPSSTAAAPSASPAMPPAPTAFKVEPAVGGERLYPIGGGMAITGQDVMAIVSKHEGNPNSVYGDFRVGKEIKNEHGDRPEEWSAKNLGNAKPLTEFTFEEVLNYQKYRTSMISKKMGKTGPFGAVGLAQFMPATLFGKAFSPNVREVGLFKGSGFKMTDKFSVENQKKLAMLKDDEIFRTLSNGLPEIGYKGPVTAAMMLQANYLGAGGLLGIMDEGIKNPNISVREAYLRRVGRDPTGGMTVNKELNTQTVQEFLNKKQEYVLRTISKLNLSVKTLEGAGASVASSTSPGVNTSNSMPQSQPPSVPAQTEQDLRRTEKEKQDLQPPTITRVIISQQQNNNRNVTRTWPTSTPSVNPMLGA